MAYVKNGFLVALTVFKLDEISYVSGDGEPHAKDGCFIHIKGAGAFKVKDTVEEIKRALRLCEDDYRMTYEEEIKARENCGAGGRG